MGGKGGMSVGMYVSFPGALPWLEGHTEHVPMILRRPRELVPMAGYCRAAPNRHHFTIHASTIGTQVLVFGRELEERRH